ncbi:MAG: hypothetical protein COB37_10895 [Kordiimonadales bacterium]|nr:MAG: hypothetical protein COB37_10895 [Kordiimonadales bacterium]
MFQVRLPQWAKPQSMKKKNGHYLALPRHGLVYARIPKAANSSIKHTMHDFLFEPQENTNRKVNQDRYWAEHESGLADLVDIRGLQKKYSDFFVFTFVRNPFCRIASCYFDKIARREHRSKPSKFKGKGFREGMSFRDFVVHISGIKDKNANVHFRAQSSMLLHRGSNICDFVGRVENMDADWATLQKLVLTKLGHTLPDVRKVHQSKSRPKTAEMYDAELIRLVRERYASDFELFYPDLMAP